MSNDVELESWRRQWKGEAELAVGGHTVEEIRRRVLRETRFIKLSLVAPILVTIGVGGAMTMRALRTEQPIDVVLAIEAWIFIVVTWVGCLWLARGTWRPLADTTAAFVDLSIRRREANFRGAIFAAALYVAQLTFFVLFLGAASPAGIGTFLTSSFVIRAVGIGMLVGLPVLYWLRCRQGPELARLRELKRQLQGD